MASKTTQFSSELSHNNGILTCDEIYKLQFFHPGDHDPFCVYDPLQPDGQNISVPKPGQTFKVINFRVSDNDLWDRLAAVVADGYLPILNDGYYTFLPCGPIHEQNGWMVFATFYAVNAVCLIKVTSDNTVTPITRGFDITYYVYTNMSAQECIEAIFEYGPNSRIMMKDRTTGTIYRLVFDNFTTNVETWKFRTSDGTGYDLVYDHTDPDNKTYTMTAITADNVWAHFLNESNWTAYNNPVGVNVDGAFTRPEGELVPLANPIHLEAGVYRFSLELALRCSTTANDISNDDLTIRTGFNVLRAMTFNFDYNNPYIQTRWCSGVFKMENAGDITFRIANSAGGTFMATNVKVSHFFINKL